MSDVRIDPPRNGEVAAGTADGGGSRPLASPKAASPLHRPSGGPPPRSGEDLRKDFPGLTPGWHYLDTAATAQKPQTVVDATVNAMGRDYATVHRGVYARSADMTLAYEAARRRIAAFIGAKEEQIAFVRGATEAINLVAYSHPKKGITAISCPGSLRAGRSMCAR